MGKTPPKEKEAEGSPRKKAARVDNPALIKASAPSPTGKEAEERPRKKAPLLDDAALVKVPVASAPRPTGKTPPKGEEAQGSPRKKAPRLGSTALATGPGASEPNPTGEAPPKGEAKGIPLKRTRSPRNKSPRRQGIWPAAALPPRRVPESSELIVERAARASDEQRCKCNHVITYSAIGELAGSLDSKDAWTCCGCQREKDKGIVKTRPEKSDLLICVTCYDHLCCGVGSIAYPFGHSRAHALKKKHWFAVLYCDPERGYCFKCNAEVPMPVKFGEHDNEVGLQVIRSIISLKLLAPRPSIGQTEVEVNPKVKMTGKLQAETHPSGLDLNVEAAGQTSDEKQWKCNHVITYSAINELVESLESKDAWTCCGCWDEDKDGIVKTRPAKRDLLICMTCYDHLCCGVGSIAYPFGHSRAHALKKKHWFAVLYCDPERGYCFKCNGEMLMPKHWSAVLYCDPERGYCFKCNAEVLMPVKFGEGDNEVGLQEIRSIVSRKLLAPRLSVGQTKAEVNPKKVEMTSKVQAESHPSGFGVDLADIWPSCETRSSDAQGYAIRGIPNLGNSCYMSAVLQCLFVLGKLQERMLGDNPKGQLLRALKELFVLVETSAAGDVLDPTNVLECIGSYKKNSFRIGAMEDSHEFLVVLRDIWNECENTYNWKSGQSDAPTVINSIFGFEMLQTLSCKKNGHLSQTSQFLLDLKLDFPSKWHPTKSAASPQTSESPRSRKKEIAGQLFPADVQRNLEKMQTVSESGYSCAIGSEVTVEETHKPLEVDSVQAQCINPSKDAVQSSLQIQEGKSVDSLTEDSVLIEDLLSLSSEENVKWRCPNCPMDHEEPSASQSKNGEQIVGSSNEDDVGDTAKIFRFITLPPVLALHINRTSQLEGTAASKISGHVRFMEDLDVKQFMDPSSADKGSTLYRLAGVVEHIGKGYLNEAEDSHYIAYVRARRLRNQQEGNSCSSSWFCANDRWISQVTLEQVLNCEAYILFYERMEDQDISGIRRQK